MITSIEGVTNEEISRCKKSHEGNEEDVVAMIMKYVLTQ